MAGSNDIELKLSIREALVVLNALASSSPNKEDELIAFMLHTKVRNKLEEIYKKKNE